MNRRGRWDARTCWELLDPDDQRKDHKCDTTSEPKFFKVKIFAWGKAAIIGHKH